MASTIKVNTITTNSGCTVTLGESGKTIALACGASQTGFGRTGTVDWITTPKVTGDSPVTGVTGKGYFLNTTAGQITLNLPAGSAGDIISLMDYAATWQTNKVTVVPNGSEKIGSVNANVSLTTQGQSVTLVYVDSTQGWLNTMDSTSNVRASDNIVATGGTPCSGAICGDYKIHTFTGPGTFCVSATSGTPGCNVVDYLVVAGGGGGGTQYGGGGGAGGYRESVPSPAAWTASPLANPGNARPVSVQGYPITVGAGGTAVTTTRTSGNPGNASNFSDIPSAGGGGGAAESAAAASGGSGGGASYSCVAGAGNTPPTSPAQGFVGGDAAPATGSPAYGGGGGGAATTTGTAGTPSAAGAGGTGATTCISATPTAYGGGGGGGGESSYTPATGGTGGGGAGAPCSGAASAGTVNTGGGGGGGSLPGYAAGGGGGGSGIVILRYKFQ